MKEHSAISECKAEPLQNHPDNVNHPKHYTSHPSGVECIDIIRHYCFDIGNVIKYCWRAGLKHEEGMSNLDKEIEDCEKAEFYLHDHIAQLKKKRYEKRQNDV